MNADQRRRAILDTIRGRVHSGAELASRMGVSRQIIVQDIALLRTEGYDILSTRRGYILQEGASRRRVYHVCHTPEQTEEELNIFVDAGGRVIDVFVTHDVYGLIRGELNLSSRLQVREFTENLRSGRAKPLSALTSGEHWHTISADSEEVLDYIGEQLDQAGFLIHEEDTE